MPPSPATMTATAIALAVRSGAASAESVVLDTLARLDTREPTLHAWQRVDAPGALVQARALDASIRAGRPVGMLAGVPLGVKDNLDVRGLPTRCGSLLTSDAPALADASPVAAARAASAVVLGKTVTTEFAYYQPGATTNPWHASHTPGGSSSGSAAAVGAGVVPLAFGTQTAGSVIRPAAFCGVFGFKPGARSFPLRGARPFAPSLDTVGWFARSADDLELMRAAQSETPFEALPRSGTLRLASWDAAAWQAMDDDGRLAWELALERLRQNGLVAARTTPPQAVVEAIAAQQVVMAHEGARAFRLEWQAHREQLSEPLATFLASAAGVDDAALATAFAQRAQALDQARRWLDEVDALIVPATIGAAPAGLGATGDPVFCRVWTLLGLPCVAVPGLRSRAGLPIGLQLVATHGDERRLLAAAAAVFDAICPPDAREGGAVLPSATAGSPPPS